LVQSIVHSHISSASNVKTAGINLCR
jgi:hypothetical protein